MKRIPKASRGGSWMFSGKRISARTRQLWSALLLVGLGLPIAQAQPQDSAHRIFDLTNQDRAARGLAPLRWNDALAAAAQAHAQRMVRAGALSHRFPDEPDLMTRAAHAGAHFQAIAENVALGPNPEGIEEEWMHSTPHRTNILDPKMNALGVGVAERGGTVYAVEDFSESSEALTVPEVEQRFRELLRAQNVDPSAPTDAAVQACEAGRGFPPGARSVVRFQTPDVTQLPGQVMQQIRSGHFAKAAVGACAPDASQGSFTTYRVAILFY